MQIRRKIVLKRCIAIRMFSQLLPVDPDLTVHIDPIKINDDLLARHTGRQGEALAVPADASIQTAAAIASR